MKSGIGALVQCGAWLSHTLDLEVLSMGRGALDREDTTTLEMCGRHLLYVLRLDGGWCFLYACPLDTASDPELLFSIGDANWEGWKQICRLIEGLEHNEIRSLQPRPLEIGSMDGSGFVIE
jgi:hypothetical protein